VGQRHVVRALTHALAEQRLHHALLFSGTRGVGKTTLARIIAKCLNCERCTGTTAEPCVDDACAACSEIDQGRFVDLIEVDAASRTGVDDMRELMENVHYAPTRGRTKVYLIDEVHMLSKHSFNALLKTLEEPPPRVQFLFATTEPEKLPVTILSRCLHFPLKRLPVPEIAGQIKHILAAENYAAADEAINALAAAADGSMRDGLSLLDQAIAFCGGELTAAAVRDMLGTIGQSQVQDLIAAIVGADARGALQALAAAYAQGMDMRHVLEAVAGAWQELATRQLLGITADAGDEHWDLLAAQAAPGDVQLYYDITLAGIRDLAHAPDPLIGARMTILRMLAFTPGVAKVGGEAQSDKTVAPLAGTSASHQATSVDTQVQGSVAEGKPAPQQQTPPAAAARPARNPAGVEADDWHALLPTLSLSGIAAQLAANGICRDLQGSVLTLELPRAHEHLATASACRKLEQALQAQRPDADALKLKVRIVDSADDAPARRVEQQADERQQEAVRAIENDPTVRQLQQRLGAQLRTETIKPNDSQ